ncbi:baseplate J/gp47 family protein [Brenneria populi]|uniref:Baseplate J/gp47 family protein n=1 Tax=Brenneria populi TaxID=1505588 RepID=A0ABU6JS97_9GAMM|nr:baseplate J/gp47 family protein [Brenneria populi Li et al. 2015]
MPFNRPTLTELRERNKAFVESELKDVGALLRFSNLRVIADADAGMSWLHYGYLDWIAKQAVPYTATDEHLAAWGAMKSVYRKAATAATSPTALFTGTAGSVVSAGAVLNRSDGYQYTLDEEITIGSDGAATGSITAVLLDPADDASAGGDAGNADAGTFLTLDTSWSGVDSTVTMTAAATGGADIEDEDDFRIRVLYAYQHPLQGGAEADYVQWATSVPGVTRAWCLKHLLGIGSVGVYIMTDGDDRTNDAGFPVGTDGVATKEVWGIDGTGTGAATGVQLAVADYIWNRQPVTALVWVCSPIVKAVDFVIDGIAGADSTVKSAIAKAINSVFFDKGDPRGDAGAGVIYLSDLVYAIADVPGSTGFVLTSPSTNITLNTGELPVLGNMEYT